MFAVTWKDRISNKFGVLAGGDGQGSASGLGDAHNVVRQSPWGIHYEQGTDREHGDYVEDEGDNNLSFKSFITSSLFILGSQPVMSRSIISGLLAAILVVSLLQVMGRDCNFYSPLAIFGNILLTFQHCGLCKAPALQSRVGPFLEQK